MDSVGLLHQIHNRIEVLQHRSVILHSGDGVVVEKYSDMQMREPTIVQMSFFVNSTAGPWSQSLCPAPD